MTDKLRQNNATAATNVNNWSGTCFITPLIGAFFADAYFGRYWTIALFSTIYLFGMLLLTLSSSLPSLRPPCSKGTGCLSPTMGQLAAFYAALYLIALGTGGIKPCVSSFGADQFDDEDPKEKKQKTSFFNWFYFSINVGALLSSSVLVYIQDQVSWSWGFGIPTVAMAIAICSFFAGTRLYRHQRPGGSPLTRIVQVIVAVGRKWNVELPNDGSELHEVIDKESAIEGSRKLQHTENFRFLDRAAVKNKGAAAEELDPWKVCTVTQVEEVKIILRILPIWASTIFFSTVSSQMSTLFVEQGSQMNKYLGSFKIPAASLSIPAAYHSIFDTLNVIIWVPLQRMGIGLFISMFSMVIAALVASRS